MYVRQFGRPSEKKGPRTRVRQFGRPSEEKVPRTRVRQFGRPSEEKVPRTRVRQFGHVACARADRRSQSIKSVRDVACARFPELCRCNGIVGCVTWHVGRDFRVSEIVGDLRDAISTFDHLLNLPAMAVTFACQRLWEICEMRSQHSTIFSTYRPWP